MFRALLFSSVGHVVVFAAFAFEIDIPLFAIQETDPIEVEIVFEEEQVDVTENLVIEDFTVPEELPEPVAEEDLPVLDAPQPEELDPLFLPESTDDAELPEGLEEFVETAEVNSNTNADLSQDLEAADPDARQPANDQSPRPADQVDEQGDAIEDLIAALEERASDGQGAAEETPEPAEETPEPEPATPPRNMPLIPKPRPRAAPVYRDLAEEQREAEAKLAAEKAAQEAEAQAAEDAAAAQQASDEAANREAQARKNAAELRSSEYVQTCVDGEWIYPAFIRYPKEWQASFMLSLNADGDIIDITRGKIGVETGASDDKISAFVESAQNALSGCEPFLNPSGGSGEAFEIEVVMQPRSAF